MGLVKGLLQRVMAMDLSTKDVKVKVSSLFNLSEGEATALIIRARSELNKERVRNEKKKILFLPQCLRKQGCKAPLGKRGFECSLCSEDCQIYKIRKMSSLPAFIVPGGSMVSNILKEESPCAAVGIACFKELDLAGAECEKNGIPAVGLPLLRDGCVNTLIDLNEVEKLLEAMTERIDGKQTRAGKP